MSEMGGTILGRCRLGPVIGQGAMGVVYEATHLTLNIPVAVKVLREPAFGEDSFRYRERFRREARIAAKLNHPGLVRVLDFGEEGELPYIVMELVRGHTLDQLLRKHGQLSEKLALQVVGHMAVAISYAHANGVSHRDLKPSNILLERGAGLKISDLGLAREQASPGITLATGLVGTPHYMAPEAWDPGRPPDLRSDIYSMGVILYQMVFAQLPFNGSPTQVLRGHVSGSPPWIAPSGGYEPSGEVVRLIRCLMEKDPDRRIQTAVQVVEECKRLLARMDPSREAERRTATASESGSDDSRSLAVRLGSRLEAVSLQDGKRVLHTSGRERVLLWILLAVLFAGALAGWIFL